jgi:hypothetical protein
MRVPIEQLGNNAHIWIFGISPALDEAKEASVLRQVDAFLDSWAAHGTPIRGARDLREGSFLVVAADENCEKSGCSIDRMFGTLKQLERELAVPMTACTPLRATSSATPRRRTPLSSTSPPSASAKSAAARGNVPHATRGIGSCCSPQCR